MTNSKKIARFAGWCYVVIFASGLFANFFVLENLVVRGNNEATLTNMLNNETEMRIGLACFLIMVFTDVIIAIPLYSLLTPIHKLLSLLAAWLRVANAIVFTVALCGMLAIFQLLFQSDIDVYLEFQKIAMDTKSYLNLFEITWFVGQLFFALHLIVLGYLLAKGSYTPTWIGIVLLLASAAYLGDSITHLLLSHLKYLTKLFSFGVVLFGVIGELSLTVWLLAKKNKYWDQFNLTFTL